MIDDNKRPVPSRKTLNQRFHDYYVTLQRRGELKPEEAEQYRKAMEMEVKGKVTPISDDRPRPRALIKKK